MNDIIPPVTLEVQNVVVATNVDVKITPSGATSQMTITEYLNTLKEKTNGEES